MRKNKLILMNPNTGKIKEKVKEILLEYQKKISNKNKGKRAKKVIGISVDDPTIKIYFNSASEAAKKLGLINGNGIREACKNFNKDVNGRHASAGYF